MHERWNKAKTKVRDLRDAGGIRPGTSLFYGNTIIPFVDKFPRDTELYRLMTTRPDEMARKV